jgi:hypothetical protein
MLALTRLTTPRAVGPPGTRSGGPCWRSAGSPSTTDTSRRSTMSASSCVVERVLALLGDDGAGKSTLMRLLSGDLSRTSGEILVDGAPVEFRGPADASRAGIVTVSRTSLWRSMWTSRRTSSSARNRSPPIPSVSLYQRRYDDTPRPVVDLGDGRVRLWRRPETGSWAAKQGADGRTCPKRRVGR